jgi:hypothetical protein
MASVLNDDDLIKLASNDDERRFAAEAVGFLAAHAAKRVAAAVEWGVGEEKLALFQETSGAQERAEA